MTKFRISGLLLIMVNIFYIYHYSNIWYQHTFIDIDWYIFYPNWEITMNITIGMIGIYLGYKVFKQSLSIIRGASINIVLMILGQLIHLIRHM